MTDMIWNFSGKTALVSGGASGIGEATVRKLAAAGAQVVFSDLSEQGGRALEKELRDGGAKVRFMVSDATDEDQIQAIVDAAYSINNRLDIAVNNVGGTAPNDTTIGNIVDVELSAWRRSLDITLTSTFLGMKHQIRRMQTCGGGAIVNISSLAGMRWTGSAKVSYSVAKAGVIRLTEFAAVAYASANIRVNVVSPGITATPAVLRLMPDKAERNAWAARSHPMERVIEPSEIADACLWACSDAASGVTGLTIPVDGGWAAK
jgi:NAD(P)-dependent dehydrogenase (short-subunit alcohol dehydrogenase family)